MSGDSENELCYDIDPDELYGDIREEECMQLFSTGQKLTVKLSNTEDAKKLPENSEDKSTPRANGGEKRSISSICKPTAVLRQKRQTRFSNAPNEEPMQGMDQPRHSQNFFMGNSLLPNFQNNGYQNNLGGSSYRNQQFNFPPFCPPPFQQPPLVPNFPIRPISLMDNNNFITFRDPMMNCQYNNGFGNFEYPINAPNLPNFGNQNPGPPYGTYEPNLGLENHQNRANGDPRQRNRRPGKWQNPEPNNAIELPVKISIKDRLSPPIEYISPLRSPPANLPMLCRRTAQESQPLSTPKKNANLTPENPSEGCQQDKTCTSTKPAVQTSTESSQDLKAPNSQPAKIAASPNMMISLPQSGLKPNVLTKFPKIPFKNAPPKNSQTSEPSVKNKPKPGCFPTCSTESGKQNPTKTTPMKTRCRSSSSDDQPNKIVQAKNSPKPARVPPCSTESYQQNQIKTTPMKTRRSSSSCDDQLKKTVQSKKLYSLRKKCEMKKLNKSSIAKEEEPSQDPTTSLPKPTTRAQSNRLRKKRKVAMIESSPGSDQKTPERQPNKIPASTNSQPDKTPSTSSQPNEPPEKPEENDSPADLALSVECQRTMQMIASMGSPDDEDSDDTLFWSGALMTGFSDYRTSETIMDPEADNELLAPPPPNISDYLATNPEDSSPALPVSLVSPSPSILSDMVPTPQFRQSAKLRLGNYVEDNQVISLEPMQLAVDPGANSGVVPSDDSEDDKPLSTFFQLLKQNDVSGNSQAVPITVPDTAENTLLDEIVNDVKLMPTYENLGFVPGGPISTELRLFSRNPFQAPKERAIGKPKTQLHPFLDDDLQMFLYNIPFGTGDKAILDYCRQLCEPRGIWRLTASSVILFFHTRIARDWFIRFANEAPIADGVIADLPLVDLSHV